VSEDPNLWDRLIRGLRSDDFSSTPTERLLGRHRTTPRRYLAITGRDAAPPQPHRLRPPPSLIETLLDRPRNGDGRHDWRDEDLKGCKLENGRLERVDFGNVEDLRFKNMDLVDLNFGGATLTNCDFINCSLSDCTFANCSLSNCDFTSAWLEGCTFKKSTFDRSTFSGAVLLRCDLYRTVFVANNLFTHARFSLVSLNQATLSGTLGLRRSAFVAPRLGRRLERHRGSHQLRQGAAVAGARAESVEARRALPKDPLIQTNEAKYRALLEQVPAGDKAVDDDESLDGRLAEAAGVWRNLSALWTSQGASAEAGWAYVQAKRLERTDASPRRWRHQGADGRSRAYRYLTWGRLWVTWGLLWGAGALCDFGNSLLRAVFWLPVFVLFWGLVYWRSGVVHSGRHMVSLPKALLFSLAQVANATPTPLSLHGSTGRVLASVETLLGIALLGLVGFVLGNTIRNS
jgi:hypothetical protein